MAGDTPNTEGCGHDWHHPWNGAMHGHRAVGDEEWLCEPCPGQGSDAPSAPNRASTDEARPNPETVAGIERIAAATGLPPNAQPRFAPTERTADRDALVERLRRRASWERSGSVGNDVIRALVTDAADALEDLARERDDWKQIVESNRASWAKHKAQVAAVRALCVEAIADFMPGAVERGEVVVNVLDVLAALDTASEDRGSGEDAAALQESEFAAGLFAEASEETSDE